jgi:Xaa-Pro aminopeptidase
MSVTEDKLSDHKLADDIAARRARVQQAIRERGLGALIIYFGGQHYMLRMNQLMYLTDFKPLGAAALLVPADGLPLLIISPEWDLMRAREQAVGVRDIIAVEPEALAKTIAAQARDLGKPLALAGREGMTVAFARDLYGALGGEPADADTLVSSLAATRTPVELERIEKAAAIADAGFAALRETACVGLWEYELAAEIESAMQTAGSDDNYGLIGAGSHNLAIRAPTNRKLEAGDLIVGEITPCYRGYFAQLCRTFILGEPSEVQRQKYDMLIRAEAAGFAAARPGEPSSGIARAVNEIIGAEGYGEYCRQPYMRTRGHGLGFGGVVPYDVTEEASPVLEPNMTMIIHPNQYIPETGYMMLGDTVVIESGGPRPLTKTPRQLFWKAA